MWMITSNNSSSNLVVQTIIYLLAILIHSTSKPAKISRFSQVSHRLNPLSTMRTRMLPPPTSMNSSPSHCSNNNSPSIRTTCSLPGHSRQCVLHRTASKIADNHHSNNSSSNHALQVLTPVLSTRLAIRRGRQVDQDNRRTNLRRKVLSIEIKYRYPISPRVKCSMMILCLECWSSSCASR